jgi:hypothetical protein
VVSVVKLKYWKVCVLSGWPWAKKWPPLRWSTAAKESGERYADHQIGADSAVDVLGRVQDPV